MPRDRHGRTEHADNDRRRRPSDGFRVRDLARFERLVEDAIALLPDAVAEVLEDAELTVEDLPPPPDPGDPQVPLARFVPAHAGRPAQATVYRRPLELRAISRSELVDLVRLALGREVALIMGLDTDLDDD